MDTVISPVFTVVVLVVVVDVELAVDEQLRDKNTINPANKIAVRNFNTFIFLP